MNAWLDFSGEGGSTNKRLAAVAVRPGPRNLDRTQLATLRSTITASLTTLGRGDVDAVVNASALNICLAVQGKIRAAAGRARNPIWRSALPLAVRSKNRSTRPGRDHRQPGMAGRGYFGGQR